VNGCRATAALSLVIEVPSGVATLTSELDFMGTCPFIDCTAVIVGSWTRQP
jgi:hypothetical protein